jgi:hypothetical protein
MTTQSLALGVSVLALLVSGIAVFIAWRSFRRAGARVAVDLTVREPARASNCVVAGDIGLLVENKGLAAIGINSAIWFIEHEDGTTVAVIEADDGPPLPMTLDGLHSVRWSFDFEEMSRRVPSGLGKARVIFSLGDGSEVSTARRALPSVDNRRLDLEVPD